MKRILITQNDQEFDVYYAHGGFVPVEINSTSFR